METRLKPGQLIKLHGRSLLGEASTEYMAIKVPYVPGSGDFHSIMLEHIGMFLGDFSYHDDCPPQDQEHFQALFGETRVWIDPSYFKEAKE